LKVIAPEVLTPQVMASMGKMLVQAEELTGEDGVTADRVALVRRMYTEAEESLAEIAAQ
jgi:hypothetical protein